MSWLKKGYGRLAVSNVSGAKGDNGKENSNRHSWGVGFRDFRVVGLEAVRVCCEIAMSGQQVGVCPLWGVKIKKVSRILRELAIVLLSRVHMVPTQLTTRILVPTRKSKRCVWHFSYLALEGRKKCGPYLRNPYPVIVVE